MGNYYRVLVYDGNTDEEKSRLEKTAIKEKSNYPNASVYVGESGTTKKYLAMIPLSEKPTVLGPEPWQDTTDLVQEHFICEFDSEYSAATQPGAVSSIIYKEVNVSGSNGEMESLVEKAKALIK